MINNMRGQMGPTEEEIMEFLNTPEGQLMFQQIKDAEDYGEAVGGGHIMPVTGEVMPGDSHEAYLEQGSTDPTSLIGDGSELPGDVLMDKSAQDYTGPPTASEFDVPSVEAAAVDPMTLESLEKRRMIEELLRAGALR
jgi:hypothetical protein